MQREEIDRAADALLDVVAMSTAVLEQRLTALTTELADVRQRLAATEQRAMTPGPAGKDATPVDMDALVLRVAELVPTPKDGTPGEPGKDAPAVDLDDVARRAEALIPKPKDGEPGERGLPGERGEKGEPGAAGERGERGPEGQPGTVGLPGERGERGERGEKGDPGDRGLPGERGGEGPIGQPGRDGRDGAAGINGKDGAPGLNGKDGANGSDGLGFDDFDVQHDGERTFTFSMTRGDRVKTFGPFIVPAVIYRGVFEPSRAYEPGDQVTYSGSQWTAREHSQGVNPDEHIAEARKAWTLSAKRGREGKQGPKGEPGTPGQKGDPGPRGPERW